MELLGLQLPAVVPCSAQQQLSAQLGGTRLEVAGADGEGLAMNAVRPDSAGSAVQAVQPAQPRRAQRGRCFRRGSTQHWKRDCPVREQERETAPENQA